MSGRVSIWLLLAILAFCPAYTWQDDLDVNLRHPFEQFVKGDGVFAFNKAIAEVRIGRYLKASDEYHVGRAGVMGNISLVSSPNILWHMGLAQETLIDDQNDISFRLLEAYYQAITGIKWPMGPGVFHVGYRHRCSHGFDHAVDSRITIKSGLITSYHWQFIVKKLTLNLEHGLNWYMFGQNSDHESQPKGNAFVAVNASWPLRHPISLTMASGLNLELLGQGQKTVYGPFDAEHNLRLLPLFFGRLAVRLTHEHLTTDFALHFSQNIDSSFGRKTSQSTGLLFGVDFLW